MEFVSMVSETEANEHMHRLGPTFDELRSQRDSMSYYRNITSTIGNRRSKFIKKMDEMFEDNIENAPRTQSRMTVKLRNPQSYFETRSQAHDEISSIKGEDRTDQLHKHLNLQNPHRSSNYKSSKFLNNGELD